MTPNIPQHISQTSSTIRYTTIYQKKPINKTWVGKRFVGRAHCHLVHCLSKIYSVPRQSLTGIATLYAHWTHIYPSKWAFFTSLFAFWTENWMLCVFSVIETLLLRQHLSMNTKKFFLTRWKWERESFNGRENNSKHNNNKSK